MAHDYEAIVIGTGFGGTMTGLSLARAFKERGRHESILMLERGTWWTTPVGTVKDKEVKTYRFLKEKRQPVQFWPSVDHFKGLVDILLRCVRREWTNPDGLYDMTTFGKKGLLGIGLRKNDGVAILHASGVGGGSLVYSNITIRPPELIFDDERWLGIWKNAAERDAYYELARDAIGLGVVFARESRVNPAADPNLKANTGLSNISTRSAGLEPHWHVVADPQNPLRNLKQIDSNPQTNPHPDNPLWIDRARVFQTAMGAINADKYGTVDSAINDLPPGGPPAAVTPANYCERQGRCNVGCLPGARHTLNKQLLTAILGNPLNPQQQPLFPNLHLEPLAEVVFIQPKREGGFEVHFDKRDDKNPRKKTRRIVTAKNVIVAAGCVNTNEIMLRSQALGKLELSKKLGYGFSTNGDYLAFVTPTKDRVRLTRGPVTTSFGHFNESKDPKNFHTLEDQGIPPAMATLVGTGVPLLHSFGKGRHPWAFLIFAGLRWAWNSLRAFFRDAEDRKELFQSEDERTARMMCVVGMGREASVGQFSLGKAGETTLRLKYEHPNPKLREFFQDPIYKQINSSLDTLAQKLTGVEGAKFENPFLTPLLDQLKAKAISLTHPLGGCRMGQDTGKGVVDPYGHVFKQGSDGSTQIYEGLYIADASIIPTALGVNPSLTISALALRIADHITNTALPPLPPPPP